MGEYATRKSDKQQIKIGTCESMYYLRWNDRLAVTKMQGSLDPATCPNLYWRLPLPCEDDILPGDYDSCHATVRLLPWYDENDKAVSYEPPGTLDPGTIQLHHPSGLLLNVKCHHGNKLPEVSGEIKACWNGKDGYPLELCGIKNHELADGSQVLMPLVRCRHCGQMYRDSWANVLPHIADLQLRARLTDYAIE